MADLAERLWRARASGAVIDLAPGEAPADLDAALAVQDEVGRLSGLPRAGWKVGSTNPAVQKALGTSEPAAAPMFAPHCHSAGTTVPVAEAQGPAIEAEFAFRLGRALPPRAAPYDIAAVSDAIAAAAPAFEVVGSRLAAGLKGAGRLLLIADGGANIGFVHGAWVGDWRHFDLADHALSVRVNGKPVSQGHGGLALGHPLNVMVWLANHLSGRGIGLAAGEIVTTGSCSDVIPVAAGDAAEADFGGLGKVTARFAAL